MSDHFLTTNGPWVARSPRRTLDDAFELFGMTGSCRLLWLSSPYLASLPCSVGAHTQVSAEESN